MCCGHSLKIFVEPEEPTSDRMLKKTILVNFLKNYIDRNETFISIVFGSSQSLLQNQNEFVHDLFDGTVLNEYAFNVEENLNFAARRKKSFYMLIVDDSKSLQ